MGILAKPLGYLLTWIYGIVGSYGWALVILTVLVKGLLFPIYVKSMKSTAKMSELQPQVQEIQQKYAKDQALMNQKVQELYKENGASATGGCLPMIVQMIVIMGLFTLLRNPLQYITSQDMIFAVHESFFWIKDLAQPDLWILPIGSAIGTYLAQAFNPAPAGGSPQQGQAMMKVMKYFFPIMILWMARSYPAGLAIYWFGSQIIQIGYNFALKAMRKKEEEKKKKAKSKKKVA